MIKLSNEVKKAIAKNEYYSEESFINDAKRYIAAVKSGRIQYTVTHVSSSGMSRNISIMSYEGTMKQGSYCTYYAFLKALGYTSADKYSHEIRVSGCGMNMLFATNYNIIRALKHMGFMNEVTCKSLAQKVN